MMSWSKRQYFYYIDCNGNFRAQKSRNWLTSFIVCIYIKYCTQRKIAVIYSDCSHCTKVAFFNSLTCPGPQLFQENWEWKTVQPWIASLWVKIVPMGPYLKPTQIHHLEHWNLKITPKWLLNKEAQSMRFSDSVFLFLIVCM